MNDSQDTLVIPINTAEAIIEPFFNGGTSDQHEVRNTFFIDRYRFDWHGGASGRIEQMWDGVYARFVGGSTGSKCLTMRRTCSIDAADYDTFMAFVGLPDWVSMELRLTVDGIEQHVIERRPGADTALEFEGKFQGNSIEHIEATFFLERVPESTVFHLKWFGLANAANRDAMLAASGRYPQSWPEFLVTEPGPAHPEIGIYFDGEELAGIRALIRTEPFKTVYEGIKKQAIEDAKIVPEACIGETNPGGTNRYIRVRDRRHPDLCQPAVRLAFIGLVDNDSEKSRLAARMALSLSFCTTWDESVIGHLPGSIWHHRSFSQERAIRAVSLVLDWSAHQLTAEAKRVLRDAIIMKGFPRLENDFRTIEYIRSMNQGIVFNAARIIGLLALLPAYPRFKDRLLEAEADLHEMIENYVQNDGGTLEGCGYWNYTFSHVMPQCYLLARYHHTSLSEYATDAIRRTGNYPLAMLSTVGDGTEFLPINDAHTGRFNPMIAAAYSQISDRREWKSYYATCLVPEHVLPNFEHLVMHPRDFDGTAKSEGLVHERFVVLPDTGQVDSVRARKGCKAIHFHFVTGPVEAGHYHEDKGSFILEAGNEALLIDRGICDYGHPYTVMLKMARLHNVLTPDNGDDMPIEQSNAMPGGRLTEANQQNGVIWMSSDNTEAWEPGVFSRSIRRVVSPVPELYIIDDEVTLEEARSVTFNVHTKKQASIADDIATVHGTGCWIRIIPLNWQPAKSSCKTDGLDQHIEDVTAIRFTTDSHRTHRALTAIEVYPDSGDYEWQYTVTGNRIEVVRPGESLVLDIEKTEVLSFHWTKGGQSVKANL